MSTDQEPFVLRLAVVIGGTTLLIGVVGALLLLIRGDVRERIYGPGLRPRVRVVGAPAGSALEVEASWREGDVAITQPAEALEREPTVWLLPVCPEGVPVTVVVRDAAASPPRLLARRRLLVPPGGTIPLDLAAEPPSAPGEEDR